MDLAFEIRAEDDEHALDIAETILWIMEQPDVEVGD